MVPQPVYMNMSDLDRMRQQKLQQQMSQEEDGLDLKTPTQEDLDNLPSSSDGSSSGYGSQNMVCDAAAGYTDGECVLSVTSVLELFILSNFKLCRVVSVSLANYVAICAAWPTQEGSY